MVSKFVVCLLAFACLAELITACSSTGGPSSTTTTIPPGRKRREADSASIEIHSNVPSTNAELLIHKLKAAVVNSDLDASRYGSVEYHVGSDASGNAVITLSIRNPPDCAELRQATQKIVKQVPEITTTSITCGGQHFTV